MTTIRQNSPPGEAIPKARTASVIAVAREGNCMGCGTCEAACPTGALHVELDVRRGVYEPVLDETACSGCGLCLAVCPGREVPIDELGKRFLDATQQHELFGSYQDLQLGYASDEQIRYQGASGGLVTALLLYALEKGLIDGAVVLGFETDAPLRTQPLIARTREEIIAASGSKYCPAAVNRILREIREQPGTYAVVGLPCQVHALRKWQARDARMRERIRYVFGLFCANENTYLGTEYFLRCHCIQPAAVRSIRYRAQGWPGEIEVRTDDRLYRFRRGTTEPNARKRAQLASAFHYDFMIPRCLVCPDQTCELADVAFADPHLPEMRAQYRDGISWCIVRNPAAAELIQSAVAAGRIHIEAFPERQARRAQNFKYKADVAGRMVRWKAMGRPVPAFGRDYVANRRMVREARLYRWSFHSHHRWTWPILWLSCVCIRGPMAGIRKGLRDTRRLLKKIIHWSGQA
jgi:coenzyme F420 hydrogenase subunit beta